MNGWWEHTLPLHAALPNSRRAHTNSHARHIPSAHTRQQLLVASLYFVREHTLLARLLREAPLHELLLGKGASAACCGGGVVVW